SMSMQPAIAALHSTESGVFLRSSAAPLTYAFRPVGRLTLDALGEALSDRSPQHNRELSVEVGAGHLRQVVPLAPPRECAGERADAHRERERASEPAPPRFQIRVAQACKTTGRRAATD